MPIEVNNEMIIFAIALVTSGVLVETSHLPADDFMKVVFFILGYYINAAVQRIRARKG
jgi:hypothetical protein